MSLSLKSSQLSINNDTDSECKNKNNCCSKQDNCCNPKINQLESIIDN
jgi:hypothetical protein